MLFVNDLPSNGTYFNMSMTFTTPDLTAILSASVYLLVTVDDYFNA
jgi:hypothetical protein